MLGDDIHGVYERSDDPIWLQEFTLNGFCIIDNVFRNDELKKLEEEIDRIYSEQCFDAGGEEKLSAISDKGIVRSPFSYSSMITNNVLVNPVLIGLINKLLNGKSILYSQVGVISSPQETLYQTRWHREIQYQHLTSSRPLMVQTLIPLCDFTSENGGTAFLPGSHHVETSPSKEIFEKLQVIPSIKAGQVVLMNSMLYHRAGVNLSHAKRRLITTAYARPFIAPQFNHRKNLVKEVQMNLDKSELLQELLGARWDSTDDFLSWRSSRIKSLKRDSEWE